MLTKEEWAKAYRELDNALWGDDSTTPMEARKDVNHRLLNFFANLFEDIVNDRTATTKGAGDSIPNTGATLSESKV